VAVGGAGTALDDWVAARTGIELVAAGSAIAAVVLAALVVKGRRDLKLALATLQDTQLELASIRPACRWARPRRPSRCWIWRVRSERSSSCAGQGFPSC